MMLINIFDVGHGGCAVVTCPNGALVMVDCGFRLNSGWFPSITFQGQMVKLLVLNNLDEDHVSDLPFVWRNVPLGSIFSNPTVTADALVAMKREHGMGPGVQQAHAILRQYGTGLIGRPADLGSVRVWAYYNSYGFDFTDTNNLSLAMFIRYGTFTILFAGDLEEAGWRALLRVPGFLTDLLSVKVFVTSHHGRENGCCDEVFWMCRPEVFVISDDEHQFDSQDTTDWYRKRASGILDLDAVPDLLLGYPRRYVLTTRHDGTIFIRVTADGRFHIPSRRSLAFSQVYWHFLGLLHPPWQGTKY